jgi:peptidoglycan-associated lipoprotein
MNMMNLRTGRAAAMVALAAAALMAGCASSVKLDEPAPVESRSGSTPGAGGGAGAGSGGQSSVASVDLSKDGAAQGQSRVIYFDYDSFIVKDEYRGVIEQQARALNADKKKRVLIEGHTDDRGGREYNLALGQKRAESVQKALALLGVGTAQVEAVSFGKERPAATGGDEASWAKNRRAELVQK